MKSIEPLAESFFNVKYRSSIITSVCQKISVTKINTGVFVVFKTKHELKCQNELETQSVCFYY